MIAAWFVQSSLLVIDGLVSVLGTLCIILRKAGGKIENDERLIAARTDGARNLGGCGRITLSGHTLRENQQEPCHLNLERK
jgi:hypothetical protein